MDEQNQANKMARNNEINQENQNRQPGAAWVEKPVKIDGLTNAEASTKTAFPARDE